MTTSVTYFISRNHAITYYKQFGIKKDDVKKKIEAKEIEVGKPTIGKHDILTVDSDGKYIITTTGE